MQFHNNILYIEFRDFLTAGWKEDTVKKANLRNGSKWQMVKNPGDARMPMVQFDTLVEAHKDKLTAHFGDVYEYMAKAPIKALVQKDAKAEAFYLAYRFDGKPLPDEHIKKYTTAASWLNMLNKLNADKKFIKKTLNLSLEAFFAHVADIIKIDSINLPATYQRLRDSMAKYATEGYGFLISGKFGNNSASKVIDQLCLAQMMALIKNPLQYDDVFVAMAYNTWAKNAGYDPITPATVTNYRRKYEAEITMSRYGNEQFNAKYIRQVKGLKPTRPLSLVESDDYNLNYYYQDLNTLSTTKDMARYVSYVVADSAFGLVLGKSYRPAKSPTLDMVKLAYIDAMYYIRSLTGGWYLPFELKADGWAKSNLHPWYASIANFVPAGHGNKHRGYIEQLFGSPHYKRAEKLAADAEKNYNGNNITAANRGANMEVLNLNRTRRPMVGIEADEQVEKFFFITRKMPAFTRNNMEAPSREAQWLEAWSKLTDAQKRPITEDQFLLHFGFKHEPQGRAITITNRGIEPQINGVKYSYDLPDYVANINLIGQQVNVIYDPYDMSRVLVTNGENIRFVAQDATLSPRALADAHQGSREILNRILVDKKDQVQAMSSRADWHGLVLEQQNQSIDPEAVMLGAYVPKEVKAALQESYEEYALDVASIPDAKSLKRLANKQAKEDAKAAETQTQHWQDVQMDYLNSRVNVADYE